MNNSPRICGVCRAELVNHRGIWKHKAGDGKRCDEILLSRRTAAAHPTATRRTSTPETPPTGDPKP